MPTPDPLVTIVIPTFNAESQIGTALKSIAKQRFESFEVLVMDGASRDRTKDEVERFKERNTEMVVRIFSEPDRGIYDAMNKGIDKARGTWICFIGSDDQLYNEQVLHDIFTNAHHLSADVIYGQVQMEDTGKIYLGEFDAEKLIFRNISHQSIFVRKKIFERLGKFDLKYKICADHIFNVKWFFDQSVKRVYTPVIVAIFGQKGISSQQDDEEKVKDLPGMVKHYAGIFAYMRFYILRPRVLQFRKRIRGFKRFLKNMLRG